METIRRWSSKLDAESARTLHRKLAKPGDVWLLNEACILINSRPHGLWWAVDQDGFTFDEILQAHCNKKAVKCLLTRLVK